MRKKALFFIAVLLGACGPDDTGGGNPNNHNQPGDGDSGDGDGDGDEGGEADGGGEGPGGPEESTSDDASTESGGEEQDPNAIVKVVYGPEGNAAVRVQGFAPDDSVLVDVLLEITKIEFGFLTTLSADVMGMQASWMLFNAEIFEPHGEPLDHLLIHERAQALAAAVAEDGGGDLTVCAMEMADAVAGCTDAPDEQTCRIAVEQAFCHCRGWLPKLDGVLCLDKA